MSTHIRTLEMAQDNIRIRIPQPLAEVADALIEQTSLEFASRSEVFRHALRSYVLNLTKSGVLPPSIVWKKK